MIIDKLENIRDYDIPNIEEIVERLKSVKNHNVGRYELTNGYMLLQRGETKKRSSSMKFESHKKYIDIQILLEGYEQLDWNNIMQMKVCEAYSEKNDIITYSDTNGYNLLNIKEGMFYVMYPSDAHRACISENGGMEFFKVVFKIPYDL